MNEEQNLSEDSNVTLDVANQGFEPENADVDLQGFHEQTIDSIDQAFEEESKNQFELDKSILTLSGATLALTTTFVKDIVPSPLPSSLWLLYSSWGCLVGSVVAVLVSFQFAVYTHRGSQTFHKLRFENIRTGKPDPRHKNFWSAIVAITNHISLLGFITGLILFVFFSGINYNENMRKAMEKEKLAGKTPDSLESSDSLTKSENPPRNRPVENGGSR